MSTISPMTLETLFIVIAWITYYNLDRWMSLVLLDLYMWQVFHDSLFQASM